MSDNINKLSSIHDNISRRNNLNLVRLMFAALVIVSHSAELVDGNQTREPLVQIFNTLSFGDVAVNGFFIISGFLISMSFSKTAEIKQYALRRAARILPGYLVSFSICFFIIAPLVGATESPISFSGLRHFIFQTLVLGGPGLPGVFPGTHYPGLNGSMWTIAYEARCYIAVALLGSLSLSSKNSVVLLVMWVICAFALSQSGAVSTLHMPHVVEMVFGRPQPTAQLGAMFATGAIFYMLREHIRYNGKLALLAFVMLTVCLASRWTAEPGFALFGGYLIFYYGLAFKQSALADWTLKTDISYGVYLYAWPIQMIVIYLFRDIHPIVLCLITMPLAVAAGFASWVAVEKPALDAAHRFRASRTVALA